GLAVVAVTMRPAEKPQAVAPPTGQAQPAQAPPTVQAPPPPTVQAPPPTGQVPPPTVQVPPPTAIAERPPAAQHTPPQKPAQKHPAAAAAKKESGDYMLDPFEENKH